MGVLSLILLAGLPFHFSKDIFVERL